MEIEILVLIPILVIIQTIIGVGVLVLGTPTLLLLNYNIIETINLLLPISILTSFLNITIFTKFKLNAIDNKKYKYFFIICIPGIFIGLKLLEMFQKFIDFELLVALIILISLYLKLTSNKKLYKLTNIKKKIIIFITGIVHGLTNSGGTLLAIFISSNTINRKKVTYEISLFYFLLASIQYAIFSYIFNTKYEININFLTIIAIIINVFIGNQISRKFSNQFFQILLNLVVFISAISLILRNIMNII